MSPRDDHAALVLDELAGLLDGATAGPQSHALVVATLARLETAPAEDRASPTRHRAVQIAVVAALAIVMVCVWSLWPTRPVAPPRASLVLASGLVELDGQRSGIDDVELGEGSSLRTGTGASACVRIEPRIDVCLEGETAMRIETLSAEHTRLDVTRGRVVAALDPLGDGARFSLTGRGVVATAVGTAFVVDVTDADVVTSVLEGSVEVVAREQVQIVEPHRRATAHAGGLDVGPTSADDETSAWATIQRVHADRDDARALLVVDTVPSGAAVLVDGEPVGHTPVRAPTAAGSHRVEVELAGHVPVRETLQLEAGTRAQRRFELAARSVDPPVPIEVPAIDPPTIPEPVAARPKAPRETRSAAEMIEHARAMLRTGELRKAEQAYVALRKAHPRAPESQTALVALGDLYLHGLGDPRAAIRSLRRYLAGGGGPLAPEARHAIVRAHRKLGDRDGEIAAIEAFLAAHPSDARAAGLRTRLADLRG